jgi:hypothetical protein
MGSVIGMVAIVETCEVIQTIWRDEYDDASVDFPIFSDLSTCTLSAELDRNHTRLPNLFRVNNSISGNGSISGKLSNKKSKAV